jgi:hypothetical protein
MKDSGRIRFAMLIIQKWLLVAKFPTRAYKSVSTI